jgi:glucose/mannose transport system permease protein
MGMVFMKKDDVWPKLALMPGLFLGLTFIYGFIIWNGVLSFTASKMLPSYDFVGLMQYEKLWGMDRWWIALTNLAILGVGYVGGATLLGMSLAILLDQKIRAEGFIRTVYLYPMALSFVVTGTVWKWLLNPSLGIEKLVHDWGWSGFSFDWLVQSDRAIYCVVMAGIWQSAGFAMALFLAGLRDFDENIIKAAQIDGASMTRIYWRIVLPSMRRVVFSIVMVLSHMAVKSFDLIMALTGGGPGYATDVPATFMYAMSYTRGQIGLGAASSTLMLMTVAAIVVPYLYSELRSHSHAN